MYSQLSLILYVALVNVNLLYQFTSLAAFLFGCVVPLNLWQEKAGSSLSRMMTQNLSELLGKEGKTPADLKGHARTRTSAAGTCLHYIYQVQLSISTLITI